MTWWQLVSRILTWSYYDHMHFSTTKPVQEIVDCQYDKQAVREKLVEFRIRKEHEHTFVSLASGLSAACTIQVFSWALIEETFWLATLLWQCSLLASIAALVSSAQSRAFLCIPNGSTFTDEEVIAALRVILREAEPDPIKPKSSHEKVEEAKPTTRFEACRLKAYFWQNQLMLMSWSWVLFLAAFSLHIATPLIKREKWSVHSTSSVIALFFGLMIFINFEFNSIISHRLTRVHANSVANGPASSSS